MRAQGWRKVASATWREPLDPQVYGDLEVDAGELVAFVEDARASTGVHVTVTHLVGRAVAHALGENPDLNVSRRGGRFVPRESVDVFFVVAVDGGRDLSGVKVRTADRDVDLRRFGLPRQPFGSALVTSVGMLGVQHAYAPLSPLYRVPFLALVSEVTERAVVRAGEVVARPMLTVSATMDHRYLDGAHAARLARSVRGYLEDPRAHEPPLSDAPLAAARTDA